MSKIDKIKVIVGQKFGNWKVLEVFTRKSLCLCEACNKTQRIISNYRLKKTSSCGCEKIKHKTDVIPGKVFGYWRVERINGGKTICICLGCNKTVRSIRTTDLKIGRTTSCGCQAAKKRQLFFQEKFGVDSYTQTIEFSKKTKETCIQKYNVDSISKVDFVKAKSHATKKLKYGEKYEILIQKMKETIRKKRLIDPNYGKDINFRLLDGTSLIDFCRKYNKNPTHAYQIYHKYGEQAFIVYCTKLPDKTYPEAAFKNIMLPYFPKLEKYDRKPEYLKINRRPDFRIEKNGDVLYINTDGLYYHCELKKIENYHTELRKAFQDIDETIFQFYDSEIATSPEVIKSIILNFFGIFERKENARSCTIKEINRKQTDLFFSDNHLMGSIKGATSYGLFDKEDNIVACLAVRKIKNGIDISRFCSKKFTSVRGGFSKLLNHIIKIYKPDFIQSFVDLRYSTGYSYKEMGFTLEKITQSWKWTDLKTTHNRLQCRANMDERKLTQQQHANELGWYKIYDAGQAKYIKRFK